MTEQRLVSERPKGPFDALKAWVGSFFSPGASDDGPTEKVATVAAQAATRKMSARIAGLQQKRVEDVMAPRADVVAVELNTPLPDLLRMFHAQGHSRMPIYRESLDDPIGMVHIKDVVGLLADPESGENEVEKPILARIRRDVLYAPPSMPVTDLLLRMQSKRIHLALVVDEFGGTDGLVTIEDLVEEIVGEIRDEHDEEGEPKLIAREEGVYDADARVSIEALEKAFALSLAPDEDTEAVDTLGGLVFTLAGRVPERGELITHPAGLEFEVVEADPRRIKKLRVCNRGVRGGETADGSLGDMASQAAE